MANYEQTLEKVRKGLKNPSRVLDQVILDYTYRTPAIGLNGIRTIGTNVFDREWDVLIVLDTARVDALRVVADEYDFIGQVDSIWSVGERLRSGSPEPSTRNTLPRSKIRRFSRHRVTSKRYSIQRFRRRTATGHFRSRRSVRFLPWISNSQAKSSTCLISKPLARRVPSVTLKETHLLDT